MAQYHLSMQVVKRHKGRSAVAMAAYRSGERLHDLRTDRVKDFSGRDKINHSEILLPENAPERFENREVLWNEVEKAEWNKGKNDYRPKARVAREFDAALPRELSPEENIAWSRAFVQKNFVDKGMVADVAWHNLEDKEGNPHMHIMLATRHVDSEGFKGKIIEQEKKEFLVQSREKFATYQNAGLELAGHQLRVDHRSYAERGIPLEPTVHRGVAANSQAKKLMLQAGREQSAEDQQKLLEQLPQSVQDYGRSVQTQMIEIDAMDALRGLKTLRREKQKELDQKLELERQSASERTRERSRDYGLER